MGHGGVGEGFKVNRLYPGKRCKLVLQTFSKS